MSMWDASQDASYAPLSALTKRVPSQREAEELASLVAEEVSTRSVTYREGHSPKLGNNTMTHITWTNVPSKSVPPDDRFRADMSDGTSFVVRQQSVTGRASDKWLAECNDGWGSGDHKTADDAMTAAQQRWREMQQKP